MKIQILFLNHIRLFIIFLMLILTQNYGLTQNQVPIVVSTPPNSIWGPPNQYCFFAYEIKVEDDDSDVSFVAKKIPSWLQLNKYYPKSAFLQGTPEYVNSDSVIIEISDGVNIIQHRFELTVRPLYNPPSFGTAPMTEAFVDSLYTYEAIVNPGAVDNSIISLECINKPEWITFEKDYQIGNTDERKRARLTGKPLNEGEYEVYLTAKYGITNVSEVNQIFTISVKNSNTAINSIDADKLKLYLSFNRNILHFSKCLSSILVFDVFGKLIKSYKNTSIIDVTNYTNGIYLLKTKDFDGKIHLNKFLK